MSNRGYLAVLALTLALFATPADAQISGQGPVQTQEQGEGAGSLGTVAGSAGHREPESTSVSLDSVAGSPGRYEGKTLARRVALGAVKSVSGAVTIGARDTATNGKLGADPDSGFALVMTKDLANRLDSGRQGEAVVTFTVMKLATPGQGRWVGVISRIALLADDGSVAKTVESN